MHKRDSWGEINITSNIILHHILTKLDDVEREVKKIRKNVVVEDVELETIDDLLPSSKILDSTEILEEF